MRAENVDFEVHFRPWNGLMTLLLSGPALRQPATKETRVFRCVPLGAGR